MTYFVPKIAAKEKAYKAYNTEDRLEKRKDYSSRRLSVDL
tara:strand:+ start:1739 stop:1858 length:120 start_codon:yes stop_codon:yes gene_type:complete